MCGRCVGGCDGGVIEGMVGDVVGGGEGVRHIESVAPDAF